MSTRDPSLFGWLLPPPGQLHPIGELLFVAIGYGFLLWLIIKLMKHFLSSKPWHKWLRRSIWTVLAVLMFIDPFYYYFGIVRGYCAEDRARVYPAPPASYVLAGPMSKLVARNISMEIRDKRDKLYQQTLIECKGSYGLDKDDCISKKMDKLTEFIIWPCINEKKVDVGVCHIRELSSDIGKQKLPFSFIKNRSGYKGLDGKEYVTDYSYDGDGHWLTKILFGVGGNWLRYKDLNSCSKGIKVIQAPIVLD